MYECGTERKRVNEEKENGKLDFNVLGEDNGVSCGVHITENM